MKLFIQNIFLLLLSSISLSASCSNYIGDYYINELNTKGNWVEIYARTPIAVSNWSVEACSINNQGNNVCESVSFSYNPAIDGYFIILDFTLEFHNKASDLILYDENGAVVNYFRVGTDIDLYPLQIAEATACGLDTACNIYEQTNNGQRNFSRIPDGGCDWVENNWQNDSKDDSNDGGIPPYIPINYQFDAWDIFRSINDRNISTKISAQSFNLTLASLNEANDAYANINATVCAQVVDLNNANFAVTAWKKVLFQDQSTATISFSVSRALKNSAINIVWKKDVDESCPLSSEDGIALSSDNFAIRPDSYNCDGITASPLISEHPYSSSFLANPFNDSASATLGYTTSDVVLSENKYMRNGDINNTMAGVITPANLNFTDGSTGNVYLSFNDVGDIGIDINDSTWADVDSDDTSIADRVVHTECRRLFRPDHFLVVLDKPLLDNNTTGFTYLSNLTPSVQMSAWMRNLNVTLTAKGEANSTMINYSDPSTALYANEVGLSPLITLPVKHSSATKLVDLIDQNSSDILGFTFENGVAAYSYSDVGFNYDRTFSKPISPFNVDGNESFFQLSVQDRLYTSVIGSDITDASQSATFYFGRTRVNDIEATYLPISNPVYFDVYDNTASVYTSGMTKVSLSWYLNNLHIDNIPGNITQAIASSNMLIDNDLGFSFTYGTVGTVNPAEQKLNITDTNSNTKAVVHLKTQEWLWYVPLNAGSAYDDGVGSLCTMHPCFDYSSVLKGPSALIIESGDFNGSIISDQNRSDYIKKGVKLFR